MVEQYVPVGHIPVEGQVAAVVVAHGLPGVDATQTLRRDETVHPAVVQVVTGRQFAVVKIDNGAVADMEGPYAWPEAVGRVDRHAHPARNPIGTRVRTEIVIKSMIFLQEYYEMLDRRRRRARPCPPCWRLPWRARRVGPGGRAALARPGGGGDRRTDLSRAEQQAQRDCASRGGRPV